MGKAHQNQLSWEQPATDQADMGQGQQHATGHNGMGNAARQEQMKASASPPIWQQFRYDCNGMSRVGPYLAREIGRAFSDEIQGHKDGTGLTDAERLFVVVTTMKSLGVSDAKIKGVTHLLFFNVCENCSQWGSIENVILADSNVTVTFNETAVPLNFPRPVAFIGRDTYARGSQVDDFQSDALTESKRFLGQKDTWLKRNATQILEGFLADLKGQRFANMDPIARENAPDFRPAFNLFLEGISLTYLDNGSHVVMLAAMDSIRDGDHPAMTRDKAVNTALNYKNKDVFATAHPTLEIQDEAIVQEGLERAGARLDIPGWDNIDVDTDVQDQRLNP
jgi:hypothetical protein